MKTMTAFTASAAAVLLSASLSTPAHAAPIDTDIMFVIDRSGSMDGEFDFLGGAIEGFINDLQAAPSIDSARAGLIVFEGEESLSDSEVLVQDLTSDTTALSSAFSGVSTRGGTEDAFRAMDSAIPGGTVDLGASYRAGAVKSLVTITDEDPDDGQTGFSDPYSNSFATGTPSGDIQALLDQRGFLNNIIREAGTWSTTEEGSARPTGAVFDIQTFRDNRTQFFNEFTATKIQEIEEVNTVPLPGTVVLFGFGLLGLFAFRYRSSTSS